MKMKEKKRLREKMIFLYKNYQKHRKIEVICGFLLVFVMAYVTLLHGIPDEIQVEDLKTEIQLQVPVTLEEESEETAQTFLNSWNGKIDLQSDPSYQATVFRCRLFGVIPIKNVVVTAQEATKIVPGGMQVGIYAKTQGVMVIGLGEIEAEDQLHYLPADNLIKPGDYLLSMNDTALNEKEDMVTFLTEYQKEQEQKGQSNAIHGAPIVLEVLRNKEKIEVSVSPVHTVEGNYKLGIWVRDDLAGVGTLTYYNNTDLSFGALGHCVSDYDTSQMIRLSTGKLYEINIVDIVKGVAGTPGELTGVIDYGKKYRLGEITRNSESGVYGTLYEVPKTISQEQAVEIGFKQNIQKGEATILSYIGGERREYSIEITEVDYQSSEDKDILFKVTDQELIDQTGGIVQGMSGSPIIQNGKIIGAVTHVFISDPEKGYGIFIEDMLE